MKYQIILSVLMLCFFSCKKKPVVQLVKEGFYPYSLYFNKNTHLTHDNDILFERKINRDSLSKIHFLKFKNDSLVFNTNELKLPVFYKDYLEFDKEFILLNTSPKTLGKNRKSTDFITKYDENFNIIKEKNLDIPKYPSGNSFIVGGHNKIYYITDWFEFNKKTKLVVSQLSDSLSIINQTTIPSKELDYLYNPLVAKLIEDVGIVIVSEISNFKHSRQLFKIDMFDLNLDLKWSKKLESDSITHLDYSESEKKIILISKQNNNEKIQFWDNLGDESLQEINLKNQLISVASNDNNIYFLTNDKDNKLIKVNFSGEIIEKTKIPCDVNKIRGNTKKIIYKNNQLFLINIDNHENLLLIERIKL